jgi:hypothetical protein
MEHHRERLSQHALALASAAEQVAESAGDRSLATYLPAALACIEQTLDALSRGCQGAARSLVPLGEPYEPVSHRFARAARDWPAARRGAGPSHERQAELLASLDDLGTSLRAARGDCALARTLLLATMDVPAEAQGRPSLHAASTASG